MPVAGDARASIARSQRPTPVKVPFPGGQSAQPRHQFLGAKFEDNLLYDRLGRIVDAASASVIANCPTSATSAVPRFDGGFFQPTLVKAGGNRIAIRNSDKILLLDPNEF